jgi:hypothetical protein
MVDVTIEDIISTAKRYPMMAERQVVIVKKHKIKSYHRQAGELCR